MSTPQPGHVVVLNQIVDGEAWIGYVTETRNGTVTAVRCWRGRLERRIAEHAVEIVDWYATTAHDLERTAIEIAGTVRRAPLSQWLHIARTAARLDELARLRREQIVDEDRERQREKVDEFNAGLEARRPEWAKNKGRRIGA